MRARFFILLLASLSPSILFAQFSGIVEYIVTYEDSTGKQLQDTEIQSVTEYHSGDQLRSDQESALGPQRSILDYSDSTFYILVEFSDRKVAIVMPKEYVFKYGKPRPEIKYKCKSKKISGYKCKLAIVTYPNEAPIKVWYTKKLNKNLNQKFEGLKGYPLEYWFNKDYGRLVQKAVVIKEEDLSSSTFSIPDDYKRMTMDEFQKSLGY